jgi:hypothetical protein
MKLFGYLMLGLFLLGGLVQGQSLTAQERRALLIASQRYPDLQRDGTPHSVAYQKLLAQAIATRSVVFRNPEWPLAIAEKSRASLPALQQGAKRVGRTDVEKYEDVIARMAASSDPKVRQYGLLEQEAWKAELDGDSAKAALLRAQSAQLRALGRIESLLVSLDRDIGDIKRELGIP